MHVADLDHPRTDPRWAAALPVLRELRPHLDLDLLAAVADEGGPQGLRFSAALDDDGTCHGVAGWRLWANTSTVRQLYVEDLVTTTGSRSRGVGALLLGELEQRARDAGCTKLTLDSGVQRHDAHRFYFTRRMHIAAHHFAKDLAPLPGT
ncbi:acetyltransferase (GNAT) family protein [Kineococcus xinjiangensis]|uniref:Acetyltransferase (GNAT) family protein n=1 Tax=Kineococcus xinjiangensis TaxID=512762 RepID=A0A2S6IIA7_9ACTN|nr:GNAT family N-acetyltransferase [Kineococcus xinjiangensis]PPK93910.1 acetyltransferase (GNAT) family protein [Kineococcus xinjiangensis]